ncbi:dipeptidase [Enhygromyxa salina]|nr:dipeptidase [Enhygromyxa salina]
MSRLLLTTTLLAAIASQVACDRGSSTLAPDSSEAPRAAPAADYHARADALAHRFVILDGHVDVPIRVAGAVYEGLAAPPVHDHTDDGDFDYARARAGGLDAPFMSIYTPSEFQDEPGKSKAFADQNIDFVVALATDHPDKFALAVTPEQVRSNFARGLISLPMGMENGSPIEGDLANLRHFHERGIRYITLTHGKDNHICDSSYDDAHTHAGLSSFGREVVAEMNRLGIMIDVSHVSDDSFWQIMELSAVPAIASHSSCRHFTPGFERNMSDEMIVALAERGGVIQINFGSGFLDAAYREAEEAGRAELDALLVEHGTDWQAPEGKQLIAQYRAEHPLPRVGVAVVADHIDHVVSVAGIDHVGLGSDFDGVGDSLPDGLKDVSMYPNLIAELLARGYTDADIEKICSGNVLRVWQAVEDHAE